MKKKYTHVLDFCFKVESDSRDYTKIPKAVLIKALKDRINRIEESGEPLDVCVVDTDDGA